MVRIILCLMTIGLFGCGSGEADYPRTPVDQILFGPVNMRLHPVFTKVRDWTGDGRADGIEAVLELQDQFGDPSKASGTVLFELYTYRAYNPDSRGVRIVAPWQGRLDSLEDQRARWNRVNRAYIFQLAYDAVNPAKDYVLVATFEFSNGGRKTSSVILEGQRTSATPAQPTAIVPVSPREASPDGSGKVVGEKPDGRTKPAENVRPPGENNVQPPTTANEPPPRSDQP